MPHRAETIIATLKAELVTGLAGVDVKRGPTSPQPRGTNLRVAISHGDEQPTSETGNDNMAFIDALLTATVDLGVRSTDGEQAEIAMIDLRARTHQIISQNAAALALGYVHDVYFGGVDEPSGETDGDAVVLTARTRWVVYYRMGVTDPT